MKLEGCGHSKLGSSNSNHPLPHRPRALGQPRIECRQRVAAQRGARQVERVGGAQGKFGPVYRRASGIECGA